VGKKSINYGETGSAEHHSGNTTISIKVAITLGLNGHRPENQTSTKIKV
jgi:hypothetical protein